MRYITREIGGKTCILCGEVKASLCLIQPIQEYDMELLDGEIEQIEKQIGNKKFIFAGFKVENWNEELSPWKAPAVFGKADFGSGAKNTLDYILEEMIPKIHSIFELDKESVEYILGGYSLAGLFSLWAGYQTKRFYGIAAASPSVWFPKWDDYMMKNIMQAKKVYLSLGDKEERTKNQAMKKVAQRIDQQYEILTSQIGEENCILEWNQGNHFKDTDIRKAKAFSWIINQ